MIVALPAPSAWAQADSQSPTDNDSSLEEILVTARKRQESLQTVPLSVSAVTGDQLVAGGVKGMADINQSVPGIHFVAFSGGQPVVSMRGNANRIVSEPGVGFFLDGVFTSTSTQISHGPVDVARLEVLKGPQGTVYGRNTIAGAVNVITNDPTDSLEGYASVGYGGSSQSGDELLSAQALISGPLTDTLSGRVVYDHKERDGFLRDSTNGVRHGGYEGDYLRAKLAWMPSDATTVKLTYEHADDTSPRWNGLQYIVGGTHASANIPTAELWFPGRSGPFYEIRAKAGQALDTTTTLDRAIVEAAHETAFGVFTSQTSYSTSSFSTDQDLDFTPADASGLHYESKNDTWSQELRLSGDAGAWSWLAGIYYLNDRLYDFDQVRTFAPPAFAYASGTAKQALYVPMRTESYAAFGQLGYEITPQVHVTLGGRWSRDEKKSTLTFAQTSSAGAVTGFSLPREGSWDSTTYLASLNYFWTPQVMSYVSYSTGFKAGGFQDAANMQVSATPFDPEKVDQIEVGLKSEFFDRRVRLNVSAYQLDYESLQVSNLRLFGTTPIQLIQNAAGAKVEGLDVELTGSITHHLIVGVSGTYLPTAKIVGFSSVGGFPSIEGFRIPRSPKTSYAVRLDYHSNFSKDIELTFGTVYSYRSEVVNELDGTVRPDGSYATVPLDDYGLLELNGTLSRGLWDVQFYVRNLTDERYFTGATGTGGGSRIAYLQFGEPRTWEVSVRRRF
ncbi:MAG TPA: TonB-dependent receptor [Steroidobacteraceae bacterium]|nr:TonB-dependent receptor [Steroidobacteraceae bacterium]